MRCEEARPLISAALDEELDGICAAQLRTHLADCVPCSTERDTLTATVRLLRSLPETEPPPALRRRIGVSLLEAERASQRPYSGLAWLRRPHAPGWAWGAALGATMAVVALLAPHHQVRRGPPVVELPNPTYAAAPLLPVPTRSESAAPQERKRALPVSRKSLTTKPEHALPLPADHLTAKLPPVDSSLPVTRMPAIHSGAVPSPVHRHVLHTHAVSRQVPSTHHVRPAMPVSLATAQETPSRSTAPGDRSIRSSDDSVRQARTVTPASTNPSTSQPPDQDPQADTTGMTEMASRGDMPAPPPPDDLTELRRRLIDRPLQVPELGQLKPASHSHPGRDGWIRF
jgi:putative zinc finger protein